MIRLIECKSREDWLEHRKGKIGGSDAASVLGVNPWKTNRDLFDEKTGRREPQDIGENPAVKYGKEAEEHLRALFALDFPEYEVEYFGDAMFVNDEIPFAHASLDGILIEKETGRKGILEIKTSTIQSAAHSAEWKDGRIPQNYYCQILHYLAVTGFEFAILKAKLRYFREGEEMSASSRHYRIEREEVKEDIAALMEAEKKFAEAMTSGKPPATILPEI